MERVILLFCATLILVGCAATRSSHYPSHRNLKAEFVDNAYRSCIEAGGIPRREQLVGEDDIVCVDKTGNTIFKQPIPK